MHHLDVVAGAFRADEGDAGRAIDLRRHLSHDRLDPPIGVELAARHHARAVQRPLLAAGHAHADEADAGVLQRGEAAVGVGVLRVAAVDQDVARLEVRQKLVDHVVDRLARLHHDDDGARLGDRRDEIRQRLRREEAALAAVLAHELVGAFAMAIVERHAKAFSRRVAGEIGAHHGEAEHADICKIRHAFTSSFACPLAGMQGFWTIRGSVGNRRRSVAAGRARVDTPGVRP